MPSWSIKLCIQYTPPEKEAAPPCDGVKVVNRAEPTCTAGAAPPATPDM